MKIKKILAMCMAVFLSLQLVACSNSDKKSEAKEKIVVSGINGSVNFTPIYIGNEKGFFEKEGIDVDTVLFDNGPVQMEALASDSWDLGFTGVGGVLSGLVSYNAKLVGATNTDNGTQTVWVRSDGKIAAAGKGKNTLNPEIVGDHDSWKGATVLCNSGTVLEYLLIKIICFKCSDQFTNLYICISIKYFAKSTEFFIFCWRLNQRICSLNSWVSSDSFSSAH